jgi:hypothetical protein
MKQIIYISFFLFLTFLLNSCKIKIIENFTAPYSIFVKGSKKGVINTISKEVIIPAKFGWIEKYLSKDEYPSTNEIFYVTTYPTQNNSDYSRSFLYDSKGKLIYTFGVGESVKSFFYYNKQFYFITKTEIFTEPTNHNDIGIKEYEGHLLLINENQVEIILTQCSINHLGSKNIISFSIDNQKGFFDLNSRKKIIKNSLDFYVSMYVENRNEIWVRPYNKEERTISKYYETVLDSTLNIKPNPVKNAVDAFEKYFLTENNKENIQITDFNGKTFPYEFPYLLPSCYINNYRDFEFHYKKRLDSLFIFSKQKDGKSIGIIDVDGKVILPPYFNEISLKEINYYTTPSPEFSKYIEDNKLLPFYYFAKRNENEYVEFALFNSDGTEIIKFKKPKYTICSPNFDLMERNKLQIKFHCTDSLDIYDLKTKKLIYSEKTR